MIQVKKQSLYILPANVEILVLRYNEFKQRGRKHQIKIACKDATTMYSFHNVLFNVKDGKFVQNELGKQLNATITDSSFTIAIQPKSIKQAAKLLNINTVNVCTY
jgi:hypothetical protein